MMNEVRVPDPFDLDLMPAAWRSLLQPMRGEMPAQAPQIRIDVSESDAAYALKAEIPGVRKEDIDVRIDGPRVTIAAEVRQESDEKKGSRVLRSERRYGYTSRTMQLATDVDAERVEAVYRDGVLDLKLPTKPSNASQRISIG
jgi:HSP20 family protein